MNHELADSQNNVMSKKPRLSDSSEEDHKSSMEMTEKKKVNGFEELGLLDKPAGGFLVGEIEAPEAEKEKPELGFDLNFPASEGDIEGGSGQFGGESRTIIDLEAENECEEVKTNLGFGYGGNGGLGSAKGDAFGEGASKRRSSSREDKGKEKVDDGDWLQLGTGLKPLARASSGHNSDDKRSDSLSFGWK